MYIVCKFQPLPYMAILPPPPPPLLIRVFWQYHPSEIPDKYNNKFCIFRRLKSNVSCVFIYNSFMSNTCQVKSITTTKSMHYWWKAVLFKHPPPIFTKSLNLENLMNFQKSRTPINKGQRMEGGHVYIFFELKRSVITHDTEL